MPENMDSSEMLHLYVLDLLGADCMLLQYKGKNLFIDLGKDSQFPQLKKFIEELNLNKADIFNTHPHIDHIGGLFLINEIIEIGKVYTAFPEDEKGEGVFQLRAVNHLNSLGKQMTMVYHDEYLSFDEDIVFRILQNSKNSNVNERSSVIHLSFGKTTMLLTSDIGLGSQKFFAETEGENIKADIMKVPHHGVESLRNDFLSAVQPKFVFYTHSRSDTKQMQEHLNKLSLPQLFATRGILHFVSDGSTWYQEQLHTTK